MTNDGKFARLGVTDRVSPVNGRTFNPARVAQNRAALALAQSRGQTYSPGYGDNPTNVLASPRTSEKPFRLPTDTIRAAELSTKAPRVPWDVFIQELQWLTGEHFALIGPTGQGKTTMLFQLLPLKPYRVVFGTKPRDKNLAALLRHGYMKLERWRSLDPDQYPHRVLWPDVSRMGAMTHQKAVFVDAFERIYREGAWTVAIDELWYFTNVLKLDKYIKIYLLQARSLDISLICATQRPAWVPTEIYDQSTHLMFWRDNDETNLKRIGGVGWRSANLIRSIVADLEPFQVLYVNTRLGTMLRTRCPQLDLALAA